MIKQQKNALNEDLNYILNQTRDLWGALRDQRLFVTGGTGFFGCWLLESFIFANEQLNLNAKMHVLTRDPEAFKKKVPHLALHSSIELQNGDVRDFEFPVGQFSHIIHAATEASAKLNAENPKLMHETIVAGAEHVLNFAKQSGAEKILFTSSGAVYGKQPKTITHISEDYLEQNSVIETHSVYGDAKLEAEMMFCAFAKQSDCEIKIARCFAFVGPYLPLDAHFAIGNFILAGLENRSIEILGDGTPYRSYLYAADLIIWLWHILIRGENGRPYNVGSEEAINVSALAEEVAKHFKFKPEIHIAQKPDSKKMPVSYVPSTQRAFRELGLQQTVNIADAIFRTIRWCCSTKMGKIT